jgi:hypothetical protein
VTICQGHQPVQEPCLLTLVACAESPGFDHTLSLCLHASSLPAELSPWYLRSSALCQQQRPLLSSSVCLARMLPVAITLPMRPTCLACCHVLVSCCTLLCHTVGHCKTGAGAGDRCKVHRCNVVLGQCLHITGAGAGVGVGGNNMHCGWTYITSSLQAALSS